MKKTLNPALSLFLFILFLQSAAGQTTARPTDDNTYRIAFYNVENLFDTIDDPKIDDAEFLPGARIPWTSERYEVKLNHLADVIKALSTPQPIAVMGLCEVENKTVLDELVNSPGLIPFRYKVIHRESQDERGIDNALIFDPMQFQPLAVYSIPVKLKDDENDHTRDILYVKGMHPKIKTDTLHIFVNHWPSRYGGQEVSEPKRMVAAETLKRVTDSLFTRNPQTLVVIIGDLNDEPSDKSLVNGLKAEAPAESPAKNKLYNLMDPLYKQGKGTLWYKDWDLFDQVIISGYFWNKGKGIYLTEKEGEIFDAEWLMYTPNEGEPRPNRTAAKDYYGGYSDHLPVYVDLILKR